MATSKTAEERAARAARRRLTKEAPAVKEPLDSSSPDLVDLLTTSAPVLDIWSASGSRPLPKEAVLDVAMGGTSEVVVENTFISCELDRLIEASPSSATVLDIITASGSRPLPAVADLNVKVVGEDASEIVEVDFELNQLIEASPSSATVLDIITASGSCKEDSAEDIEAFKEVTLAEEEEEAFSREATFSEEIIAIIATPDDALNNPIANHLYQDSLDQGPSASFHGNYQGSQAGQDVTSNTRHRKAYISPALLWLEEEGLPTAEMEAMDVVNALGGKMDKETVMRRAMEKWKRMSLEEKAIWRARANANQK